MTPNEAVTLLAKAKTEGKVVAHGDVRYAEDGWLDGWVIGGVDMVRKLQELGWLIESKLGAGPGSWVFRLKGRKPGVTSRLTEGPREGEPKELDVSHCGRCRSRKVQAVLVDRELGVRLAACPKHTFQMSSLVGWEIERWVEK